jgi:hypothetical protein
MESHRRGSQHATGDDSHTTSWSAPRTGEHLVHAAGDQGVDALEEAEEETAGGYPPAEGRPARGRQMPCAAREPSRRRAEKDLTTRGLGMVLGRRARDGELLVDEAGPVRGWG